MRRPYRAAAALTWLALAVGGCAAISGLSSITEQACAPDCDGGAADGTVPVADGASPGSDSPVTANDATLGQDTAPPDDASAGQDAQPSEDAPATNDASDSSAPGTDAGDAGHPPPVDSGTDAGGCGSLDTIANCSACGKTCTPTNATAPACNGTTCSYTCATNALDCNASVAPDTDGCECANFPGATAADCCLTACPIAHSYDEDVTTATFYACVTYGTYNLTLAMDACTAFTGDATQCDNGGFNFYCDYPDGGLVGDMVCSNGPSASVCDCWGYSGAGLQGFMATGTGKGEANCLCPQTGGTKWE